MLAVTVHQNAMASPPLPPPFPLPLPPFPPAQSIDHWFTMVTMLPAGRAHTVNAATEGVEPYTVTEAATVTVAFNGSDWFHPAATARAFRS